MKDSSEQIYAPTLPLFESPSLLLSDRIFNSLRNIPIQEFGEETPIVTLEKIDHLLKKYPEYADFSHLSWSHGSISPQGKLLPGMMLVGIVDNSQSAPQENIPGQFVWSNKLRKLVFLSKYGFLQNMALQYIDPDIYARSIYIDKPLSEEAIAEISSIIDTGNGFILYGLLLSTKKKYFIKTKDSSTDLELVGNLKKINIIHYPAPGSEIYEVVNNHISTKGIDGSDRIIQTFYRGHSQHYGSVSRPSRWRQPNGWYYLLDKGIKSGKVHMESWSSAIFHAEIFLTNIAVETISENANIHLTHQQAHAFLQHYMAFPLSDAIDVTESVDIAKWFALNIFDGSLGEDQHYEQKYKQKVFKDYFNSVDECVFDLSCVYVITTIRSVLDYALPMVYTVFDMTKDFCKRSTNQKAYCIPGSKDDIDNHGVIVNISELKYHPLVARNGWDTIGGPSGTINGIYFSTDSQLSDNINIIKFLFPKEIKWVINLAQDLNQRIDHLNFRWWNLLPVESGDTLPISLVNP